MGKVNRKKGTCDKKLASKKTQKPVFSNPFEVHINRSKFNVLGRKTKNDRGLPGVARSKFINKRKVTLLQEYKIKEKSNKFIDRRIGEYNKAMTKEDRIIARFTAERMKAHKRKTMYNLADDEVLTHRGQSLAEIERYDDPRSDDDDDDEGGGGLDAKFVDDAHFGGGMFRKSETSRMSVIDQLIADSKKRKAEKQQQKEKTLQMTEKLDSEWRELIPVISSGKSTTEVPEKKDSFDILMNELKFSARGKPSERLKSEDEIAAEEARRLKELEEERIRRMRGDEISEPAAKRQHRSADDLDDGLDIDEDRGFSLMYDKDGVAIGADKYIDDERKTDKPVNDGGVEKSESDEEEGSEEEEETEEKGGDEENDNGDGNEGVSDTESDDDSLEDLKLNLDLDQEDDDNLSDDESSQIDATEKIATEETQNSAVQESEIPSDVKSTVETKKEKCSKEAEERPREVISITRKFDDGEIKECEKKGKKRVSFNTEVQTSCQPVIKKTPEELEKEARRRQELMEEARKQLPFTFTAPTSYEEFQKLMADRSIEEQVVIIERIIKCNHPSLGENNKKLMGDLFAYLLQHINDASYQECWTVLDRIAMFMFDLTQFAPNTAADYLREVLNEKYSDYAVRKNKYPPIETLAFLKLVPLLFPTSDKRHPVTTPAVIFMSDALHNCSVTNRKTISCGLFIVSLMIEFTSLSKRICPQALNFLTGIIHLATPPSKLKVIPPFKQEHKFLYLHNPYTEVPSEDLKMLASDLLPKAPKIDNIFRVRSLNLTLSLLNMLAELYKDLPAVTLLFEPVKKHIDALEIQKYPEEVKTIYNKLLENLEEINSKELKPILLEPKKPKTLRLYEPNIQPVYEGRKRKFMSDEKAEHEKLVHKYKKEMKGAIREIRRDRVFLNKIKIKEQIRSDNERKKKVNQIYRWAAEQQCELKKFKRKK